MQKKTIYLPYGRGFVEYDAQRYPLKAVLMQDETIEENANVAKALENPIGTKRLSELTREAKKLLIITSDHTRPLPSRKTLPFLLQEARRFNPELEIKILIATGCHRAMNEEEMKEKFGALCEQESFLNHDAFDQKAMVFKGNLPSGGALWLNKLVDWADVVVSEGFIEPHFFAGFSGGRKSVLPGIASAQTVYANHCAAHIGSAFSRTGNLENNPIHADMLYAARRAALSFILNVVLNEKKEIVASFAGDPILAHQAGCDYVRRSKCVQAVPAEIVVVSNGGYPFDQNLYQAVKGMTAAEACVQPGGVIVMLAACTQGDGGESFRDFFTQGIAPAALLAQFERVTPEDTAPDQWQAQILARVMTKARVVVVSEAAQQACVESMQMLWAQDLAQAMVRAYALTSPQAQTVVIPDGVGVIVNPAEVVPSCGEDRTQ